MATLMGIHRNTYNRLEQGQTVNINPECPSVIPLHDNEKCFLHRRRSKYTQQECADDMGITRFWYNFMENGKAVPKSLMEYWYER